MQAGFELYDFIKQVGTVGFWNPLISQLCLYGNTLTKVLNCSHGHGYVVILDIKDKCDQCGHNCSRDAFLETLKTMVLQP